MLKKSTPNYYFAIFLNYYFGMLITFETFLRGYLIFNIFESGNSLNTFKISYNKVDIIREVNGTLRVTNNRLLSHFLNQCSVYYLQHEMIHYLS